MKIKLKLISLLFFCLTLITGSVYAQETYCPYYVECFDEGNSTSLRLYFNVGIDELGTDHVVTFYQGGSILGPFPSVYYGGNSSSSYLIFPAPCAGTFTGEVVLEIGINSASVCLIDEGQLQHDVGNSNACSIWAAECGYALGDFVADAVLSGDISINGCDIWNGDCGPDGNIWRLGDVIIGSTTMPSNFKLGVQGDILTEQFKVCPNNNTWCDYVFDEEYDLKSLHEVESFIESNGHLPNTLSEKEEKLIMLVFPHYKAKDLCHISQVNHQ